MTAAVNLVKFESFIHRNFVSLEKIMLTIMTGYGFGTCSTVNIFVCGVDVSKFGVWH